MMDMKESSVTVRLPSYMKQYLTNNAKNAGVNMGEYVRCMIFSDMLLRMSNSSRMKLAKLKDIYEACDGTIPESMVSPTMGVPDEPHDYEVEKLLCDGLVGKTFDPITKAMQDEVIDNMVEETIESVKKSVPVEPKKETREEPVAEPIADPEPLHEPHKLKRPKMGAVNSMM